MAYRGNVAALIRQYSRRYRVDPAAALAVASTEGGVRWGAVGDNGTSFGPFQLHRGGALPRGRNAAWANSPAGIAYAIRSMANAGARGKRGGAAINAIVRRFERPAAPGQEVAKAISRYKQYAGGSPMNGSFQPTGFGGGGSVNRSALIDFVMANNASFAATGQVASGFSLAEALKAMRSGSDLGAPSINAPNSGRAPRSRAQAMVEAMRQARRMGLSVRENPMYDKVDPVHTKHSYHYQRFNPSLGRAADISGSSSRMAAFTRWARRRYGSRAAELFYDPLGGWKHGSSIGAIGGHSDHVHIAF